MLTILIVYSYIHLKVKNIYANSDNTLPTLKFDLLGDSVGAGSLHTVDSFRVFSISKT